MNAAPILATALVLAFALAGTAKVAALPAMRSRAEHVGFTIRAYQRIGTLELLAAVGLIVGVVVPGIGVLAAAGLLVLLGGAVTVHVRNGDGAREIAPALVLGLATMTYLVLAVTGLR